MGCQNDTEDEDTHIAFQSHSAVRDACRVYGTHTSWEHRADMVSVYCALLSGRFRLPVRYWKERILASSPAPDMAEQKKQNISGAKAVRRLGYIWLIRPLFYVLDSGLKTNPIWVTALGFSWAGFLSWASFHEAKKMELKARQDSPA